MSASRSHRPAVRSLLIIALCVGLVIAGGAMFASSVSAQAGTPVGNNTDTNTNESVNGSGSSGGGGGGCGVENLGACFPTAGEVIEGGMNYITNSVVENLEGIVDGFNDLVVGVPAPGEADDPSTWVSPEDGWWPDIYETYYIFTTLAMAALVPTLMFAMDTADSYRREQRLKRLGVHAGMILLGALFVMPASLHFFDIVATSLAPSGEEFFSSAVGVGKLGIGVVLGTGLALYQSVLVLIGIAVLLMIYVAIHILAAFWPIFWIARLAPVSSIRWVGNAGIAGLYGLCFLRVLQSGMLRFLFNLSWNPIEAGIGSALGSVLLTIVGLYFIFVLFPKKFVRKGIPASAMISGGSQAMKKAPERYKQSRERIGNVRQRLETIRGGGAGGRARGSAHRFTGGVNDTWTNRRRGSGSGSSGSAGGDTPDRQGLDASAVEEHRREINERMNRSYQ